MIILVLANEKESDKPFWRLIFLNEEDERPKYHLYYRKDGVKEIETTKPKYNILDLYEGFSRFPGEFWYDKKKKEIIDCNNNEIVDLDSLTYNNDEYDKSTNTIWILSCLERSEVDFRLYLISEVNPDIVERNVEINILNPEGYCFSLVNTDLCDYFFLDTLKRNNIKLSSNTSIIGLPIFKTIDLFTGKTMRFDKENFDDINKYIKIINFTGD